jgi:hypothetical protein
MTFPNKLVPADLVHRLYDLVGNIGLDLSKFILVRIFDSAELMIVVSDITHVPFVHGAEKVRVVAKLEIVSLIGLNKIQTGFPVNLKKFSLGHRILILIGPGYTFLLGC